LSGTVAGYLLASHPNLFYLPQNQALFDALVHMGALSTEESSLYQRYFNRVADKAMQAQYGADTVDIAHQSPLIPKGTFDHEEVSSVVLGCVPLPWGAPNNEACRILEPRVFTYQSLQRFLSYMNHTHIRDV
jgi:hypothetical protein